MDRIGGATCRGFRRHANPRSAAIEAMIWSDRSNDLERSGAIEAMIWSDRSNDLERSGAIKAMIRNDRRDRSDRSDDRVLCLSGNIPNGPRCVLRCFRRVLATSPWRFLIPLSQCRLRTCPCFRESSFGFDLAVLRWLRHSLPIGIEPPFFNCDSL
jgi:hypothetical protein